MNEYEDDQGLSESTAFDLWMDEARALMNKAEDMGIDAVVIASAHDPKSSQTQDSWACAGSYSSTVGLIEIARHQMLRA